MAGEENKAIYRKFVEEVVNQGKFEIVDELFSPGYLDHSAPPGAPGGLAGVKAVMGMFRGAFPDVCFTIQQMVGEGDMVATFVTGEGTQNGPFMGMPPSGKHVRWSSTGFFRVQDNKIVEHWGVPDLLAIMNQIRGDGHGQAKGMSEEDANLGRRSHKEWLEGHNPSVVDEIYAADCVIYGNHVPRSQRFGREGFKTYGANLYTAFPDLKIHHDMVVTDESGQYQMILWTFEGTHLGPFGAIPPTGRKVSISGVDVFRVANGQIQELYLLSDVLGLLQQLGPDAGAGVEVQGEEAKQMTYTRSYREFPVRYMEEVFNQRKFEVLDELFSADLLERIKQTSIPFLMAFPDWHGTVDEIIVDGNRVVNRWTGHGTHLGDQMGIPATGKPVTISGITVFHIAGGKVVEEWTQADLLGLMQQIGIVPAPG